VPFPESALNDEAGKLFMEDYDEYKNRAKLFTQIYATQGNKGIGSVMNKESYNNINQKLGEEKDDLYSIYSKDLKVSQYSNLENEEIKEVKENINEELMIEKSHHLNMKGINKSGLLSSNPVLGNVSSNQISQKTNIPVQTKKNDKKKWLKRI